ncbi:MAG TPA: hypothetical protein DCQ31_03695, partial [Bacteroidales bacterium]|nr:hypothetical protein [Bacteroidales bacterium]
FMVAVYHGRTTIAEFIFSKTKKLSLHEAAAIGNTDELERNLANKEININGFAPDGYTALALACFFGNYEAAEHLIKAGANVNLASNNESAVCPIHAAVASNRNEIAHLLLENRANPNKPQHLGIYPIHSAVHRNNTEMVQMLIENGANARVRTDSGKSVIEIAADDNNVELERMLRAYLL